MKQKLSIVLLLLFLPIAALTQELKKVSLQLSWFDQFQFAGYYMAKHKGLYKKAGLDVTIVPFEFGIDVPQKVASGHADFGIGRETLILDKSKGLDVVALYALFQSTPLVLLSTQESGITSLEDFKNKKIMTTNDDASEVSIKAMIRSKNIANKDLHFIQHTHNINDLIENKTDIISAYISKSPFLLEQKGIQYNVFDPKKFGFDMYSDLLFTNSTHLRNNLQTVVAFKNASLLGWEYAYSNIKESVDLIYEKYNPQNLSKEELFYEAKELKKLSYFHTSKLGHIKKEKLQRIYDLYNIMGLTKNRIDFDKFVYNSEQKLLLSETQKQYLHNKHTIKACIVSNAMPYSDIKDSKAHGAVAEFIQILERRLDTAITLVESNSVQHAQELIQNGKCEIMPTAQRTPDNKEKLHFTQDFLQIPSVVITQKNKPFVNNLSNLKDVTIGMSKALSLHNSLQKKYPDIEFKQFENLEKAIEMVNTQQVYGIITPIGRAWYILQKQVASNLKVSGKLDEKIKIRIAVNKNNNTLYHIMSQLVKGLDEKKIQNLSNKWVYVQQQQEFDYTLLYQLLIAVLLITIFILYRQHLLRKMNQELNLKVKQKTLKLKKLNATLEQRVQEEVEENIKKERLLAENSKMASLGEMIGNIAHQWRQPLSAISSAASGLQLKKEFGMLNDEEFYEFTNGISKNTQYLSQTIDDFRNFLKSDKVKSNFQINNIIQRSLDIVSSSLKDKNITVINNAQDSISLLSIENEIAQALINIFNNAKDKLIETDKEPKLILIETTTSPTHVTIALQDNGGGIDEQIIGKIFEPYFSTKHSSIGTGLGLYMTHQIICESLGGNISVSNKSFTYQDKEYLGACFQISLPL